MAVGTERRDHVKELLISGTHWVRYDDDAEHLIAPHRWQARVRGKHVYAVARIEGRTVYMHRLLTSAPSDLVVDHIDGNALNNRRANLRVCTRMQNFQNAGRRETPGRTSRFKGAWRVKEPCRRCWRSGITANRKYKNIGSYSTEEEAARAYDAEAKRLHGQFARLNFTAADDPSLRTLGRHTPASPPVVN